VGLPLVAVFGQGREAMKVPSKEQLKRELANERELTAALGSQAASYLESGKTMTAAWAKATSERDNARATVAELQRELDAVREQLRTEAHLAKALGEARDTLAAQMTRELKTGWDR
jgi:hypothetical protein